MGVTRTYKIGDEVPAISKTMTQEAINLFEKSGGKTGPSQFTDEATARETLGTRGTVRVAPLKAFSRTTPTRAGAT